MGAGIFYKSNEHMKTAIKWLDKEIKEKMGLDEHDTNQIKYFIDKALEKEKKQIVNAFEIGYKSCDIDEAFEINRKLASGELYYNKTYNNGTK
jgi:hypothetical protein